MESVENSVCMSEPVDTVEAFDMFIEFAYSDNYTPKKSDLFPECVLHVGVYGFADRICSEKLKQMALEKLSEILVDSYEKKNKKSQPKALTNLGPEAVVAMAEKAYFFTPSERTPRDPLRTLVARFCASCVAQLRLSPLFMLAIRDIPGFGEDLFGEVGNGIPIKADSGSALA